MRVDIVDADYALCLSRREFLLLTDALNEHLLLRGGDFDVVGYTHAEARAFLAELGRLAKAARRRQESGGDV